MNAIPVRAQAYPSLVMPGDMIAIYAGNPDPSYAVTVDAYPYVDASPTEEGEPVIAIPTDDGTYRVPESRLVGIAAWAPVRGVRGLTYDTGGEA